MAKQYYAVVDDAKHEVLGMSPKVASELTAVASLAQHVKGGRFSARPLGARKAEAEAELSKVKAAVQATARQHHDANIKATEAEVRKRLNEVVSNYNDVRAEFLAKVNETDADYANLFKWSAGSKLVTHEYQANVAARILNNAEENPERHLIDWLFVRVRYELKLAVEMRHEGSSDPWRLAVRNSQSEGRRCILESMTGIAWALHCGQRCIAAREELGLPPPPWTKVEMGFVKAAWDVPGFESGASTSA